MRFSKPWYTSYHFLDHIDVTCPTCGNRAVSKGESEYFLPWRPKNTKFTCTNCALINNSSNYKWQGPVIGYGRRPCGQCGHQWVSVKIIKNQAPEPLYNETQADCPRCNNTNLIELKWKIDFFNGEPVDPYFGQKLWYISRFKDFVIWGYNLKHLSYIKDFIASSLRERGADSGKYSMVVNLPKWMKLKKHRKNLLKVIEKLLKK